MEDMNAFVLLRQEELSSVPMTMAAQKPEGAWEFNHPIFAKTASRTGTFGKSESSEKGTQATAAV